MKQLVDFLNHGILPFVGRERELERLCVFWEGTFEAYELRAALLLGEGGIGKSRLLDELTGRVSRKGGMTVRAKLIPESTVSVPSLIARSIWYGDESRRLIASEPGGTVGEVSAALRRLSRLRPLLLILEDVHLLQDEASREFALLLDSIGSESLSLVCAARPFSLKCRASLERHLVDDLTLQGLSSNDIRFLLRDIFNISVESETIDRLHEVTAGNPLALRGTLRSALRMTYDPGQPLQTEAIRLDPHRIGRSAQESVAMLAEGMASHLLPDERRAAAAIASLGEVVGAGAARAMLDDLDESERMIDRLLYKGVLSDVRGRLPSLPGDISGDDPSLTFTHSLLHQVLVGSNSPNPNRLLEVVGNGMALYSIIPLRSLNRHADEIDASPELLMKAIRRVIGIARHLNATPEWPLANEIWETARRLFERLDPSVRTHELALIEADLHETALWLMNGRLGMLTEGVDEGEYRRHLECLLAITSDSSIDGMPLRRIDAYRHQHVLMADSYLECLNVWNHVDRLIAEHPPLFLSEAHVQFLIYVARTIARYGDTETCRRLKARVNEMVSDPEATDELKRQVHIRISLPILPSFTTEEELKENLRIAEETETNLLYDQTVSPARRMSFENAYAGLLFISGRMEEGVRRAGRAERLCGELGHSAGVFQNSLTKLTAEGALGTPLDEVLERARTLRASHELARHPRFSGMIGMYLAEIGLLRNRPEWTEAVFAEFAPNRPHHYIEADVILAAHNGTPAELLPIIPDDNETRIRIKPLIRAALGDDRDRDEALATAREWIGKPILATANLLTLHAAVLLVRLARTNDPAFLELDALTRVSLANAMEWLDERGLFGYMSGILELYPEYFSTKETANWDRRIAELSGRWKERRAAGIPRGKVRVSMLGSIAIHVPGEEPTALRGGRLKTLLGLLTGTAMLDRPLSRAEFHRIATGDIDDPNLARKNTNMASIRLREALGAGAIRMGDETHELDLQHVEIDLLQAHRLLHDALQGLANRSLLRAGPAIAEALEIVNGEVPFPGLYDDFFESLREDFEAKLRRAAVDIARALIHEGDPAQAEGILRRAFETMPEDEEIAELLAETLIRLDKRAEAVRVRMRPEDW